MKKYCFFFIFLITSIIFSQNDSLNRGRVHYDLFIGTFVPTQNAKLIGVKPVFGASFGIKHKRMNYDLTFDVRIGKSKHKYQLANAELSNNYVGGYLGIDILRDVWTHKKNQILLLGGIGIDLFEIEPAQYRDSSFLEYILFGSEEVLTKESINTISYNFNFGLMYRHYFRKNTYFGIRYRFNFVNYNSKKILTDLSGNFHSITLSFGGFIEDP